MLTDFAAAAEAFERMGSRPYQARVDRNWGDVLLALGRTDDGKEKLRAALALFDEMGITREAGEVRATLEATPS